MPGLARRSGLSDNVRAFTNRAHFMRVSALTTLVCVLPLSAAAITLGGGGDPRAVDLTKTFDFATPPEAAAGIEIVPYEELAANELYAKFTAKYDSGIRVGYRKLDAGKGGSAGETVVYVSPRGRPFAPDNGTISPQSTGTFVRASYPLNAEFLTGSAVIDLGTANAGGKFFEQAKADVQFAEFLRPGESQYQFVGKMGPGARLWLKQAIVPARNPFTLGAAGDAVKSKTTEDVGINTTVTTRSTSTSQSVSFDEALYYDNAARSLEAMHRMFMLKVIAAR